MHWAGIEFLCWVFVKLSLSCRNICCETLSGPPSTSIDTDISIAQHMSNHLSPRLNCALCHLAISRLHPERYNVTAIPPTSSTHHNHQFRLASYYSSPHTHNNTQNPPLTTTWPCGPGQLQPGPNLPSGPSQLIDHCWHISNWAGIDKGHRTGPRGPATAEKSPEQTLCDRLIKPPNRTLVLSCSQDHFFFSGGLLVRHDPCSKANTSVKSLDKILKINWERRKINRQASVQLTFRERQHSNISLFLIAFNPLDGQLQLKEMFP